MSSGTYKPQFHVHSTQELSLSFSRHTKSENTTFLMLSQDYTKSVHLQSDRSLEFHTPMGCHYEVRLPRFGRDLAYLKQSTEVLVPAVGLSSDGSGLGEVFRLDLERGQFLRPWQVDVGTDDEAVGAARRRECRRRQCCHSCRVNTWTLRLWDDCRQCRILRSQEQEPRRSFGGQDGEVTALDYSKDGLSLALGTSTGQIRIFDLRNPRPPRRGAGEWGFPSRT